MRNSSSDRYHEVLREVSLFKPVLGVKSLGGDLRGRSRNHHDE